MAKVKLTPTDPTVFERQSNTKIALKPLGDLGGTGGQIDNVTALDINKYQPYLKSVFLNEGLDEARAQAQTAGDLWAGALSQAASEIVLGTLEGTSYLLDFEQMVDKVKGDETEYTNWFADKIKQAKKGVEEIAPLYQTKDAQEGFAFGDATWWASNAPSIASSLSLLIPAAGATKLVGTAAKGLRGAMGLAALTEETAGIAKGLTMATFSRYMENTMEASQTFDSTYQKALSLGYGEQEAKQKAGEAASNTWNANSALWVIDALQFSSLMKVASKAGQAGGKMTMGEFAKQMGGEGLEEVFQGISSAEAEHGSVYNTGFAGEGFGDRMKDYLTDPKIMTAGFFGALGGGVFAAGGTQAADNIALGIDKGLAKAGLDKPLFPVTKRQVIFEGLAKERALYLGDTVKANKIDDNVFTRIALNHIVAGKSADLKATLEQLQQTQGLESDARENLRKRVEDLEFLDKEIISLREKNLDSDMQDVLLGSKLSHRFTSRNLKENEKALTKLYGDLVQSNQLGNEFLALKQAQITAASAKLLAGLKPTEENKTRAAQAEEEFNKQLEIAKTINPKITSTGLTKVKDDELIEKTFAGLEMQDSLNKLNTTIEKVGTKEGQAEIKASIQSQKEVQEAQALITKQDVTTDELKALQQKTTNPVVKGIIATKLNQLVQEKKQSNKERLKANLEALKAEENPQEMINKLENQQVDPEKVLTGQEQVDPDKIAQEAALKKLEEQDTLSVFDEPEDNIDELLDKFAGGTTTPDEQNRWLAPKAVIPEPELKPIIERVKVETKDTAKNDKLHKTQRAKEAKAAEQAEQTNTIVTFLKQTTDELDPDTGRPVEAEWYKGDKPVKVTEIFETTNGILYKDSPLLQVGDPVALVLDNGFGYQTNPGFKVTEGTPKEFWTINVYRVLPNGRLAEKPLCQLPNGNKATYTGNMSLLNQLREEVIKEGKVMTTVASKSYGEIRKQKGGTMNSLAVLEYDYIDGKYQKQKQGPVLILADFNGDLKIPNLSEMGLSKEEMDKYEALTKTHSENAGALFTGRTNARGTKTLAMLHPRQLNEREIQWVKDNFATELKGNAEQLNELVYIPAVGYMVADPKKSRLNELDRNRFTLMERDNESGDVDLFIPLESEDAAGVKSKIFVSLSTKGQESAVERMMKNQPFKYTVYFMDGRRAAQYTSDDAIGKHFVNTIQQQVDELIKSQFHNTVAGHLNSDILYTDPVTGDHKNYYEFLLKEGVVSTDLPGSINPEAKGTESSYSFSNAGVHIALPVAEPEVVVNKDTDEITIEHGVPVEEPSKEKKGMTEDEALDAYLNRPASAPGFKVMTPEEITWFTDRYGKEALAIAEDVDRILSAGGLEAFGYYHNALVTLAGMAETGTIYHEAFHFTFAPKLGLISERLRNKVLEEAKQVYGNKSEKALEELLAEDFRLFMLSDGKAVPKVTKAKSFFGKIWLAIKNLLGMKGSIEKLFKHIDNHRLTAEEKAQMGVVRSLESEEEPKYRLLPGFKTYTIQEQAIDATVTKLMEVAKAVAKESDVDLLDVFTDTGRIEKFMESVKADYLTDQKRISEIPEAERSMLEHVRMYTYSAMGLGPNAKGSWTSKNEKGEAILDEHGIEITGFKDKALRNLVKYGFRVLVKDTTTIQPLEESDVATIEDLQEENSNTGEDATRSGEHIHDRNHTYLNPTDGLSTRLKMFLSTVPNTEGKTTMFGTPQPIAFNRVWAILSTKLAESDVPSNKLFELAEVDQVMSAVHQRLTQEAQSGNTRLLNEFNTKFNLSYHDFVTALATQARTTFIEANRTTLDRTLREEWREEAVRKKIIALDGSQSDKTKAHVGSILNKLEAYSAKIRDAKPSELKFDELVSSLKSYLSQLGVFVPEAVFDKIRSKEDLSNPLSNKPALILRGMIANEKANSLLQFVRDLHEGKDAYEKTGLLTILSKAAREFSQDRRGGTFLDEFGNPVFPYQQPSFITEFFREAQLNPNALVEFYKQDKAHEKNKFLAEILNNSKDMRMVFVSAARTGKADAKSFEERNAIDSFITRLVGFHNSSSDSSVGYFSVGTFADKSKQIFISLKKEKSVQQAKNLLKTVLINTGNFELIRMNRIKDWAGKERRNQPLPQDIIVDPKTGRTLADATEFKYVPGLNEIPGIKDSLVNGELENVEKLMGGAETNKVFEDFINDQYNKFLFSLERNGLITLSEDGPNNFVPSNLLLPAAFVGANINDSLKSFFYHDTAYRLEMSKIFMGDIAQYKNDEDYIKRAYQLVTPGLKPAQDPNNPQWLTRVVYKGLLNINDVTTLTLQAQAIDPSVTEAQIQAALDGEKTKNKTIQKVIKYLKVNKTDAQSFMTIDSWKKLVNQLGGWTKKHDAVYEFAWKHGKTVRAAVSEAIEAGKITREQGDRLISKSNKVMTSVVKPFQFRDNIVTLPNDEKMLIKEQFKDSITPLIPELTSRHQGLRELSNFLRENKADIASAHDTVKVGLYGQVTEFVDADGGVPRLTAWQKRSFPITDLRLPQSIADDIKTETAGSQFHKLVVGDVLFEGSYNLEGKTVTGEKLIEDYNSLWAEKLANAAKALREKFGFLDNYVLSEDPATRNTQIIKLKTRLQEELLARQVNENFADAIELIRRDNKNLDFVLPLAFPTVSKKFAQVLTGIFKKNIIKQKMTGTSVINLADFTVDKDKSLKYTSSKDGELQVAEIGLSIDYFSDIGLNFIEHTDKGRIRWDKLNEQQKKALEMILYRIPTSNKSSMTLVRVALLLPPNSNVVMIPGELTTQQGLDFDVDKSNLIRRALTKPVFTETEGKKARSEVSKIDKDHVDTKLFNIYWSILSNPVHLAESMTPLTTERLEEKLNEYKDRGVIATGANKPAFFTATADVNYEVLNKDAKIMIGVSSKHNTGHSVIQMIKDFVHFKGELMLEVVGSKARFNKLGEKYDAKGFPISENHGEVQQAHLDAAKTPLMGYMNVNRTSNGALHTMLSLGVPLDVAMDFFSQPVIKEWTRLQTVVNMNYLDSVSNELFERYPDVKTALDRIKDSDQRITDRALSQALVPVGDEIAAVKATPEHSARVLKEFFKLMKLATTMTNINNVLSIDTLKDMTGPSKIEVLMRSKNSATSKDNPIYIDDFVFNLKDAPKTAKRVAAFYQYAVEDARQLLSQLFPYLNSSYINVKRDVHTLLSPLDTVESIDQINTWIDYYNSFGKLLPQLGAQYPNGLSNTKSRWDFYGGTHIMDYITDVMNAYPALKKNEFLSSIRKQPSGVDKLQAIGISNTNTYALKNDMILGWYQLLNPTTKDAEANKAMRILGLDLVYYAMKSSGFSYGINTFLDLVPTDFWVESGIAEQYRNILKTTTAVNDQYESSAVIDTDGLITGFVRQNFASMKKLPSVYLKWTPATTTKDAQPKLGNKVLKNTVVMSEGEDAHVVSFSVTEAFLTKGGQPYTPRFIKILDTNDQTVRLYEANPLDPSQFKEIQSSGDGKNLFEVSPGGRHRSANPAAAGVSPDPWKQKVKVTPQTKEFSLLSDVPAGQNKFLTNYIPTDKTDVKTVLEKLIKVETDIEQKKVLELLLRNVGKINTPIEIVETPGKLGVFEVTKVPGGRASVIKINPFVRVSTDSEMRHILAHEIEHAFTVAVLQNPATELQMNFNRNIERLREDALKRLGEMKGTEDRFEFIAELASNPEFRNKLKGTDLWSRLLRAFRKLFGMKDSYDKLLEQRYAVIDQADNLQRLSVSEYAMAEEEKAEKEKPKGKKTIDLVEKMLSGLQARADRLRRQGKEAGAKSVQGRVDLLKELAVTDRAQAITRYLIDTDNDIIRLKGAFEVLAKNPDKLNPAALVAAHEQLESYSILDAFADQIRKNPLNFIPNEESVPIFLNRLTEVRNTVRDLKYRINEISLNHYTTVVMKNSTDPNLTIEKVMDELRVASRDIGWGYHVMTSIGVDSRDLIVKTNHKLIKEAHAEADRRTFSALYNKTAEAATTVYRYFKKAKNQKGEEYNKSYAREIDFKQVGIFKATEEYEAWLTANGKNKDSLRDKYNPIIDKQSLSAEDSDGIRFVAPNSAEGIAIMAIPEGSANYPLRQFYETIVLGYLKAQGNMPKHMRPGLRVPSIAKSFMEGTLRGEWSIVKDKVMDAVQRRYDEADRKSVDENGKPLEGIPVRYIGKQDGTKGRLTRNEVSMDFPTTVAIAVSEFNLRAELGKVQAEAEMGKLIAKERRVLKANKRTSGFGLSGFLTADREATVLESGEYESMEGVDSNAYKKVEADMRRLMYGMMKKDEGKVTIKGKDFDIAKIFDNLMKFTGLRFMFANVAIPLTNIAVGELTMLKEVVGGNMINTSDYKAGWKFYTDVALKAVADFGNREKKTKAGRVIQFLNPIDSERPIDSIGVNSTYMRTVIDKLASGSNAGEFLLGMQATGAVLNRFKAVNSEGKEVGLYEAIDITDQGKATLLPGYTYKGKKEISSADINEVRNYVLRTYESMHGVYNRLDSPVGKETIVGRLVLFMRNWLPEGINNRWRTRFFDERLNQENEGYYTSSLIMFNNIFGEEGMLKAAIQETRMLLFMDAANPKLLLHPNELELSEEQQEQIIALRQANIRKTVFELYLIGLLSLLLAFGWDEDDDDSYFQYMTARIQRELLTFISPATAWDVVRSPTVALNTVDGLRKVVSDVGGAGYALMTGEELPVYKQGPKKGQTKLGADAAQFFGLGFINQFEGLDTKTRLIKRGWN